MGTDYSSTIFGDWASWLDGGRKCCFCKLIGDLSRVSISAYSGHDWYYFHDKCLSKVLADPDKYKQLVDYANEIQTEIGRYKAYIEKDKLIKSLQESLRE